MTEDRSGGAPAGAGSTTEYEPPPGAETIATWGDGDAAIAYTVRAKWTVLRKDEKPAAEIFSVAYVGADRGATESRPVTFVFNGGPGASSAYLQMGALGPTRVAFGADGSLPQMPPRLVPNSESWLPFTDLVFVDPVGTGFSRVIPADARGASAGRSGGATSGGASGATKAADGAGEDGEYFGYKKDLESLCEFIGRWLSEHRRWGSPVLIAGESYGGYRVGRLVRMLQESAGIGLNGAILISPAMEISGLAPNDYDVLAWIDLLPTMALTAVHHGRSREFPTGTADDEVVRHAELFATTDYAALLTRGAAMPVLDRQRIFKRQADLIGLPFEFVIRAEGRIDISTYTRELLRDERKVLGLYDATITTTDPFPDRAAFEGPDATLAGATPVYTAAINRQLRGEIGIKTDREYLLLNLDVNAKWTNDAPEHFFAPPVGATDDFRYGMALNPHLKAFISHGRYDLVTPFSTTDRLVNLMRLDPETAARLTVRHFGGGHMFYAWEQSRRDFTAAIRAFYAEALPAPG